MVTAPRVIREQTRVQNRALGTPMVQASTGAAQAVINGANQIGALAWRYAAEDAEIGATEAAEALKRSDLMTIDPETGEPLPLSNMQGMGRIASEAYRRVVDARYMQAMEEDLRNRSAILAEENRDDPDAYAELMADYIGQVTNLSRGSWRQSVADVGTDYLNRTRTQLTINAMRRQRSRLASGTRQSSGEAQNLAQAIVQQQGIEALIEGPIDYSAGMPSVAVPSVSTRGLSFGVGALGVDAMAANLRSSTSALSFASFGSSMDSGALPEVPLTMSRGSAIEYIYASGSQGIQDAIDAGVITDDIGWDTGMRSAVGRGLVNNWLRNLDLTDPDSDVLVNALQNAVTVGDIERINRISPVLGHYLSFLANDPEAADDFRRDMSSAFTTTGTVIANASAIARRHREQAQTQILLDAERDAAGVQSRVETFVTASPTQVSVYQVLRAVHESVEAHAESAYNAELSEDEREAAEIRMMATVDGAVEGLMNLLVVHADTLPGGIGQLRDIVSRRAWNELTPNNVGPGTSTQTFLGRLGLEIRRLEDYDPDVVSRVRARLVAADSDDAWRDEQRRLQSLSDAEGLRQDAAALSLANSQGIGPLHDRFVDGVMDLPGLTSGERDRFVRDIAFQAMTGHVRSLLNEYGTTITRAEMLRDAMQVGPVSVDLSVFPRGQRQRIEGLLSEIRRFAVATGRPSDLPTVSNRVLDVRRREIERVAAVRERQVLIDNLSSGTLDMSESSNQRIASEVLSAALQEAGIPTEGGIPSRVFLDEGLRADPRYAGFFRFLARPGVMPEELVQTYTSLASGGILDPDQFAAGLSLFRAQSVVEAGGRAFQNTAMQALPEETLARLRVMSDLASIHNVDANGIAEMMGSMDRMQGDAFETEVNYRFNREDGNLHNALLERLGDTYAGLSRHQQRVIQTNAAFRMGNNLTGDVGGMVAALREQIDLTYPVSDFVFEFGDNGLGINRRSRYALQHIIPNHVDLFAEMAMDRIRQQPGLENALWMTVGRSGQPARLSFESFGRGGGIRGSLTAFGRAWEGNQDRVFNADVGLVPVGRALDGGMAYQVMSYEENTQSWQPVMHDWGDETGAIERVEMIFSTNEPYFRSLIAMQVDSVMDSVMDSAQEIRDMETGDYNWAAP